MFFSKRRRTMPLNKEFNYIKLNEQQLDDLPTHDIKYNNSSYISPESSCEEIEDELKYLNIDSKNDIDNNNKLLREILHKINNLEKKFEEVGKTNIKIDELKKNIDTSLIEKDYVIDQLKEEVLLLTCDLRDIRSDSNILNRSSCNDYFG